MNPDRWARVKALFAEALEVPAAERESFLTLHAGTDLMLVAEVKSLLAAHDRPGEFLETVPAEIRHNVLSGVGRVGERLGAYRIVGILGTGGMGDVFKALRDDQHYRAEVAIKLMRADVRSSLTEQRFKTERQILAGLDHRNIARLLDGGTTANGLPYVVMELVVGIPIDRFCEERELSARERVRLFLQVCAAVSYAHQHLVVHRDLKPNNILVTDDGSVKLLDFGIAKLLEGNPDTRDTDATVTQWRAMTLEYASPEQVSGGTVTTVSDVYSLGVVLYRLLTGKSPYSARTNDSQRIAEILSDATPTRPSLVHKELDSDLDNVLLMALRKEPQRRYGSVEQFSNDLRNYLSGLPVHARGNALQYRMAKFARRHKVEIAAGVIVLCSLVGGLGVAIGEAREAERQRLVAQQHFDSVRRLANKLLFDIHDEMEKVPGSTKSRALLVQTSLEYLDTLHKGAGNDPALQEELGVAYQKVGEILGGDLGANTGDADGARDSYAKAVELLAPLVASQPTNYHAAIALAKTYQQQARQQMTNAAGASAALIAADKSVALVDSLEGKVPDEAERIRLFVSAMSARSELLIGSGKAAEAVRNADRMVAVAEKFWLAQPDDELGIKALSSAYNNASMINDDDMPMEQAYPRAVGYQRKAIAQDEKLVALKPADARYRASLEGAQFNLSGILAAGEDYPGALALLEKIAPAFQQRAAADPDDAWAQLSAATVSNSYAAMLFKLQRLQDAKAEYLKTAAGLQALVKRGANLRATYALAENYAGLGDIYASMAASSMAADVRQEYWRRARDAYKPAIDGFTEVDKSFKLTGSSRILFDTANEGLSKAQASLSQEAT